MLEIHPAIGIARVGDSTTGFSLGPEPGLAPPATFRDASGLKRQAARFRVYDCQRDATGQITFFKEIKVADAQIVWSVHLTNRKAAARQLDGTGNRNHATGNDAADQALINDPGERTVTGTGQRTACDQGAFLGKQVPLGEIRTDADGRLLVLGGVGNSGPIDSAHATLTNFADNDGWFDDTSDGPVKATVTFSDGTVTAAEAAWVVVGPPDFAPGIDNAVRWLDVAIQAAVDNGLLTLPAQPSFKNDVMPILTRMVNYRFVNKKFADRFGPGKAFDFAAVMKQLSDPAQQRQLRHNFFTALREPTNPTGAGQVPKPFLPPVHDDQDTAGVVLAFTRVQYGILKHWAEGTFLNDVDTATPPVFSEPDALTRTALAACVGGPFFPGIEAGRIIADKNAYHPTLPFRMDASKLKPGQLTQGNALPWQADFFDCQQEGPLAWWPAQRPDLVPTPNHPDNPQPWALGVSGLEAMVALWSQLGFLVAQSAGAAAPFLEQERVLNPPSPR